MLKKLILLNFKTVDGVTRFFRYGAASKGIVVDRVQTAELEAVLRSQYLWWMLPMALGVAIAGPILPALFLPAMLVSYYVNTADILYTVSAPDRISPIDQYRKVSLAVPAWAFWTFAIASGTFVLVGCLVFINEGIAAHRAARLGSEYDDSVLSAAFAIVFFGICMAVFKGFINVKKRAARADAN